MAPKSKQAKSSEPLSATSKPPMQTPNWPPLHPLAPPSTLSLTTLYPSQILTISTFFTTSLCSKYISFLRTLPLTTTPGKPKRGDAVRVNDRYQIDDPAFASRLWNETGLKALVEGGLVDGEELGEEERRELWGGEVVGLNPNVRVYRYGQGQFFDRHYDDSNTLTLPHTPSKPSAPSIPAKTTWTLLLYLSSPLTGCTGGETVFYPDPPTKRSPNPAPVVAELEVGMALLHRHGRDCMLHEGKEVRGGEKWVVRSDLCVRR